MFREEGSKQLKCAICGVKGKKEHFNSSHYCKADAHGPKGSCANAVQDLIRKGVKKPAAVLRERYKKEDEEAPRQKAKLAQTIGRQM